MGSEWVTLMERVRRKPILFLLAVTILLFYVTPLYHHKSPYITFPIICKNASCLQASSAAGMASSLWEVETHPDYLVYSPGCKIMEMNAFDKSVTKFLKRGKPMKCNQRLTKLEDQRIVIDDNFRKSWKTKKTKCCFRSIHRVQQRPDKYDKDADWGIKYSSTCHNIPEGPGGAVVNSSYIKVECQGTGKIKGNVEFHGTVLPPHQKSENVKRKAEYWDERRSQGLLNPPSILVIGIDSISRMHMIRSLPKTREFLQKHDFVEMKGYNKVGENTFPNIMAGFAGMGLNNYSSCWANKSVKLDDCPYIWKNYSDLNYVTAFLEDSPGIAIFNYVKHGFVEPPADYYMRPLTVAIHKHYGWYRHSAKASCVGGITPTDFQTNFIKKFILKMGKNYPYFLLSWFTSIGHDDFNGLKTADNAFLDLLSTAMDKANANPDNTLIVFMSDHGYRFGNFRETFLGFYEESLPFFFFRLPKLLRERHPEWYANLVRNSRQLTSPLDLHSTLKHVLYDAETITSANLSTNLIPSAYSSLSREEVGSPMLDIQLLFNEPISNLTVYGVNSSNSIIISDETLAMSGPLNPQYRSRYSFFEFIPNNRTCEASSIPQRYCMCGVTPAVSKASTLSSHLGDVVVSHVNYMLESVIKSGKCATLKFSNFLYGREVGHGEIWNNFNQLINYKDYLVALEASPSKGHFEAKIRILQNETKSILGDISRINSYQGQSECIPDFKLKSYCFCNKIESKKDTNKKKRKQSRRSIFSIFSNNLNLLN